MAERNYSKIQLLAILIILIIFPLLSWYYLQQGLNYQRSTRAELSEYGKLAPFRYTNLKGQEFNLDSLESQMSVLSFIGANENDNKTMLKLMQKLHEQFGKSNNLQFLTIPLLKEKASVQFLKDLADEYELTDPVQHHFLSGKVLAIRKWLGTEIQIPKEKVAKDEEGAVPLWVLEKDHSMEMTEYPYFVLVDTSQTIRNYYNYKDYNEVKKMVEQIAIIIPPPEERDAIIRREKEK